MMVGLRPRRILGPEHQAKAKIPLHRFIYALGIGVPFFLIGVFTVRLPRGGVWMEWVKSVLGIREHDQADLVRPAEALELAFGDYRDAFRVAHAGELHRGHVARLGHEVDRQ